MRALVGPGGGKVGPAGGLVGPAETASRNLRVFGLGVASSSNARAFALEGPPPSSQSVRRFALSGPAASSNARAFALAGPARSLSFRRFALAGGPPASWGSYVGSVTDSPPASTALAASASAGATSITVLDGTNVLPGTILVGAEVAVVASRSGAAVQLAGPLLAAHAGGEAVTTAEGFVGGLQVADKAGVILGAILDHTVTSPPSTEIGNPGSAAFKVPARSPYAALVFDDRLVAMQTPDGEEPWLGTMTVQGWDDGELGVEVDDALSILADGAQIVLKESVPDGTLARDLYRRALDLHNADAALSGEVEWELDAAGSLPFRGDLDFAGSTLGLVQHIAQRSGSEFARGARVEAGRFVPILRTRDRFVLPGGPALHDLPLDPTASIVNGSIRVTRDPTPLVHEIKLTGASTDLASCLPSWAAWAGHDVTPEVTVSVNPGPRRKRAVREVTIDWGLSKAVQAQLCNDTLDELWGLFGTFLKAVHDMQGRPFHEGYLWTGPDPVYESFEAGADILSRRQWHTRRQLVETFEDTPAAAVMISDATAVLNRHEWLILTYNRRTGESSTRYWAFPLHAGASLTAWHVDEDHSITVYFASAGRIYDRTTLTPHAGVTPGTGAMCESYSTRLWDPVSRRYRFLRRILNGHLAIVGFVDPNDPDLQLTDLGGDAGIDMETLSSLIGKMYDFEAYNVVNWDPRRDGVGEYLARRTIFAGKVTTRGRWHLVSWGGDDGAVTRLTDGVSDSEVLWSVETTLGFPREDHLPFTLKADDGLKTERVLVTQIAGGLWTVLRGQDGTVPVDHEAGTQVELVDADKFDGFHFDYDWPEGRQYAQELLDRLSRPRILLNLRVALARVRPSQVPVGTIVDVQVTTEGPAAGFVDQARVLGGSPDPLSGELELVLDYPYVP